MRRINWLTWAGVVLLLFYAFMLGRNYCGHDLSIYATPADLDSAEAGWHRRLDSLAAWSESLMVVDTVYLPTKEAGDD